MRETIQFDTIYSLKFLIISIIAFPLSSSFEFIIINFLRMAHMISDFYS